MIITKRTHGYSSRKKYIQGQGFMDSLASTFRSVGSYVGQNKDLLARPLLGAVGNLAAAGVTEGGKALLDRLMKRHYNNNKVELDSKAKELIETISKVTMTEPSTPVSKPANTVPNIIGSGIKRF
jgi:hypothetical protein